MTLMWTGLFGAIVVANASEPCVPYDAARLVARLTEIENQGGLTASLAGPELARFEQNLACLGSAATPADIARAYELAGYASIKSGDPGHAAHYRRAASVPGGPYPPEMGLPEWSRNNYATAAAAIETTAITPVRKVYVDGFPIEAGDSERIPSGPHIFQWHGPSGLTSAIRTVTPGTAYTFDAGVLEEVRVRTGNPLRVGSAVLTGAGVVAMGVGAGMLAAARGNHPGVDASHLPETGETVNEGCSDSVTRALCEDYSTAVRNSTGLAIGGAVATGLGGLGIGASFFTGSGGGPLSLVVVGRW